MRALISILKDVILFLSNLLTVLKAWVDETRKEHKFTNVLIPIIVLVVLLLHYFEILFKGGFYEFFAWAAFFVWVGMNVQGLSSVYKKLRPQFLEAFKK